MPALLLSGCATLSDPETSQDSSQDAIVTLQGEKLFSQAFVARRPRLNSLTLFARPDYQEASAAGSGPAKLSVELYPSSSADAGLPAPGDSLLFHTSVVVGGDGPVNISLPPLPGPAGQRLLILLRSEGRPIFILGRKGDVYPLGQAYEDGRPIDADLAFQTTYDYNVTSLRQDLGHWTGQAWLVLPLILAFLVPGWLLLDLSGLRRRFDGGEQAAISAGLSLAVIALLMLWTSLLGLRWSASAVMFGMGIAIGLMFWRLLQPALRVNVQLGGTPPPEEEEKPIPLAGLPGWAAALALGGVFLLSLGVRLAMVRDLAAPAWVDSVHHALIARLILQSGGYPPTYAPFLDLPPTEYHAGYHASLAVFTWLSQLDLPSAMLISGQFLNALAVLSAYLLAVTLTRSRLSGLLAALATGLFSPMPAYYTSWGRYTELAGLLILPIPLAMLRLALPETIANDGTKSALPWLSKPAAPALLLAIAAAGGLFLVHYRVTAFLAIFLAADVLVQLIAGLRLGPGVWKQVAGRTLAAGALLWFGALLLALPWVWPNLTSLLLPALDRGRGALQQPFADFSWRYLNAGLGRVLLGLAVVGLLWGLVQRRRFAFSLPLWVAGMFFLANLGVFRLPGWWLVNNTSVAILLFLPISSLAGYLLDQVFFGWSQALPLPWKRLYGGGMAVICAGLAVVGAVRLLPVLNPTTFLFRAADLPAMKWIEANIPPEEAVLINPFQWGYHIYAGNDGGFWISPLAGRKTLPPPVIYAFGDEATNRAIGDLSQKAIDGGADPRALSDLMRLNGIRYLYIGARGGPFSAYALSHSPLFQALYAQNGTWLFETVP